MHSALRLAGTGLLTSVGPLTACGGDSGPSTDSRREVVEHYAAGVHASYSASLVSATDLDGSIQAFVADPTDATMAAAKEAWLAARDDYGLTEAFRFYGGPIDDEETGPEGRINAWPLDEAYIDYVEGDESAGIINAVDEHPEIDAELITSLNEAGGEANISSGWHAIEFLLWGQDLSETGAGERPVTDYTDGDTAERRATYLGVASTQLLADLASMVDAWAPDVANYRADFVAQEPDDALTDILTGIGELTRGELAGERMNVAYEARSQEDEHSCFSDNTTADLVGNELGIQTVLTGAYPGLEGPGVASLVEDADADLAEQVLTAVDEAVAGLQAIPAPFDQHLADGVPDDSPGRAAIRAAIDQLDVQADRIVAAADALGLTLDV